MYVFDYPKLSYVPNLYKVSDLVDLFLADSRYDILHRLDPLQHQRHHRVLHNAADAQFHGVYAVMRRFPRNVVYLDVFHNAFGKDV